MSPDSGCDPFDFGCGIGEVIGGIANDQLTQAAQEVAESFGKIMASLGTFWIYIPTPNLAGGVGSNSDVVLLVQNSLVFFVAIAALVSLIIGGARIAITQRAEGLRKVASGIFTLVLVTAAGVPVLSLLIIAGDEFSIWIVNRATGGTDFGTNLGMATALTSLLVPGGPILVIILGVIAIVVSLTQVVLILVRMVMLVVLAGMLPVAGSFAATNAGADSLKRYIGWIVAFLLYKPVAAVIYATAFALISNGVFQYDSNTLDTTGQATMNVLAGLLLMILAVAAIGALMRFAAPAVSAIGGSAAGGAVAAGVAAAASGAVSVMGMRSLGGGQSGNAGATGGSGPSGAGASRAPGAGGVGAAPAAGSGAGAAASSGGGAAAGASAGAAGGPVGAGAGLAAGAALQGVSSAASATRAAADDAVGGGPDGSN
ncbi:hypothetical protein PYV02_14745 [Leifsonia sp. H3M29-4]|jgi:type IV secretion system protein TrbL|uniref:hypothetical protein n=1 Tax=Salinibacterium metalliresistens TaxID=3031321 RepID=UPI0023DC65D8|nr:hypothetical protein [Salinibacterium metalliresistens]MDF1480341.1 hypothetical protein [Salinibacterium metalliresistens]